MPNRFCGVDHDAPDATAARGADVVTPSPDAPPPVLLRFDSTTPRVLRERFRAGRLDALPCACKLVRLLDSAGAPDGALALVWIGVSAMGYTWGVWEIG